MSVKASSPTNTTGQRIIETSDETYLHAIADHLKNNNLPNAQELYEMIQGIYAKNLGYLLVSLWHLGHLNVSLARSCLKQVHPSSYFDRHQVAKTSIEIIIQLVESHLAMGSIPVLGEDIIREEFFFHTALLRQAAEQCIKNINAKELLDREAHASQQQLSETSHQSTNYSSETSKCTCYRPYPASDSTDSDTSSSGIWIES